MYCFVRSSDLIRIRHSLDEIDCTVRVRNNHIEFKSNWIFFLIFEKTTFSQWSLQFNSEIDRDRLGVRDQRKKNEETKMEKGNEKRTFCINYWITVSWLTNRSKGNDSTVNSGFFRENFFYFAAISIVEKWIEKENFLWWVHNRGDRGETLAIWNIFVEIDILAWWKIFIISIKEKMIE